MDFFEYSKTLDLSRLIIDKFVDVPKTHTEWADRFNKVGDLNDIIISSINKPTDE